MPRMVIGPLRREPEWNGGQTPSEGGGERGKPAPPPEHQAPVSDWDAYQAKLADEAKAAEEKKAEEKKIADEKRQEEAERQKEKADSDYQARRK